MVKYLVSRGGRVKEHTKCPGHPAPLALAGKAKKANAELTKCLRAHGEN